jgi:hypothetical protein
VSSRFAEAAHDIRSSPSLPTVSESSGEITVVELYSSTIAGPLIEIPSDKSLRR